MLAGWVWGVGAGLWGWGLMPDAAKAAVDCAAGQRVSHVCLQLLQLQPIAPHLQSRAGTGQDIRSVSWLLTCFSSPMRSDSASIDRSLFRSKDSMSMASCTHACSLAVQHCCAYCQSGLQPVPILSHSTLLPVRRSLQPAKYC